MPFDRIGRGADGSDRPRSREPISLVVPTRDEEQNVGPLLERVRPLAGPVVAEVLFVDDSDDATPVAVDAAAADFPVPVRCIHRPRAARGDGLSGAVVTGMRAASAPLVGVIDADLQHPPEVLAELRDAVAGDTGAGPVDLAYGTRFSDDGRAAGFGSRARRVSSAATSAMAKALFPRRLREVSDPMSGLFVVRRDAIELERLHPRGFKILLEVLVRNRLRTVGVGYRFAARAAGETKASVRVAVAFLLQLVELRVAAGRFGRGIGFALVGASGLVVNNLALWVLVDTRGYDVEIGAIVATQVSTLWNFLLLDLFVFPSARRAPVGRLLRFWAVNNVLLVLRVPLLALLATELHYLVANVVSLVILYLARFALSDRWVWAGGLESPDDLRPAPRHSYDVAGIVSVRSDVRLRELARFAGPIGEGPADIELRIGTVGGRLPGRPGVEASSGQVRYTEHLGGLVANFSVDTDGPIDVRVSPVLAASPHVVYTNIVEAILRFVLVARGCMLLHSATVELDGTGVMLSARTDTGKTGTVLRLTRERGAVFFSDDMTIVRPDGVALAYPKPLTISAHTLAAVAASPLRRTARWRLAVQSRIHSKGGRSIGAWLAQRNVPIMAFNAMTQVAVPPPKYHVEELVDATTGAGTRVRELFIIERGHDRVEDLDEDLARRELLANTDDAYGFPPFAQFAPAITIDGADYPALRRREEAILAAFLRSVRVRRLGSTAFSWADEIPRLLDEAARTTEATGSGVDDEREPEAPEPVIDLRDDPSKPFHPVASTVERADDAATDRRGRVRPPARGR